MKFKPREAKIKLFGLPLTENSSKVEYFGEMVQKGIVLLMKRDTMGVSS